MQSTETLKYEHRVIEVVLEGLESLANDVESGKPLDREKAEKALEIIRNFADRCHHAKEEKHLFALMEERGVPRQGGPSAVMLQEHERGRAAVRAMVEAVPGAANGDAAAAATFVQNARTYVELLRQHKRTPSCTRWPSRC
jgi:hemerythrin-like domain-containing protein